MPVSSAARVLARWFPLRERGLAQGFVLTCSLLGGAVAALLYLPTHDVEYVVIGELQALGGGWTPGGTLAALQPGQD